MRVLAIIGDSWHPSATRRKGLQGLGRRGFDFDWSETANDGSAERLDGFPVAILSSAADQSGRLDVRLQQALLGYVQGGKGLLVLHAGAAAGEDAPVLRKLIGGYFRGHPEPCVVTIAPGGPHAVNAGCKPFEIVDEHYFMHLDAADTEIVTTAASEHGTQPAGWVRPEGTGRVCVLTPGHDPETLLHPGYQRLVRNALRWCGGPGG